LTKGLVNQERGCYEKKTGKREGEASDSRVSQNIARGVSVLGFSIPRWGGTRGPLPGGFEGSHLFDWKKKKGEIFPLKIIWVVGR